jgi:hypothetical protein
MVPPTRAKPEPSPRELGLAQLAGQHYRVHFLRRGQTVGIAPADDDQVLLATRDVHVDGANPQHHRPQQPADAPIGDEQPGPEALQHVPRAVEIFIEPAEPQGRVQRRWNATRERISSSVRALQ